MGKQVQTRTVTTTITTKSPRKFPTKVLSQATGAAILVGIGFIVANK